MNHRPKIVVIALLVLTIATLIADTYRTKAQLKTMSASLNQAQDRIVRTKVDSDTPIRIKAVKTKGGEIKMDEKFFADDDWIRGLNIRLANHSSRTVTFVGLLLLFSRTEDQKPGIPAGWPFEYGLDPFDSDEDPAPQSQFDNVLPGRDLDIELSDTEYENLKSFLRDVQFPGSVRQMDVDIIKIGFNDGTAWNNGYLFRRDPQNKTGPLKGWVSIGDLTNSLGAP